MKTTKLKKTAKQAVFNFFSPLIWICDVLFNKERFRAEYNPGSFTSRMTYCQARQEAKAYNRRVKWSRGRKWRRT